MLEVRQWRLSAESSLQPPISNFRPPDYLVIGHVCQDVISPPGGTQEAGPWYAFGGTVTYAARTARALGLNVAALTSAAPDFTLAQALPGIQVHRLPSAFTTTFENQYLNGARRQVIHAVAGRIGLADVPALWRQSAIVHLGPVAQEVDPALVGGFPGALIGLTPQGWLRAWDAQGYIHPSAWENVHAVLPRVDAVVFSIEDVGGDEALVADWAARAPVLVVTHGARGATLHVRGEVTHVPAPRVHEVEPTGAGDIFAAAFFTRLRQTQDPYEAARFATCLASTSVTRKGLDSIPTAIEVERCRRETMNLESAD